jgi:hypothetical protein
MKRMLAAVAVATACSTAPPPPPAEPRPGLDVRIVPHDELVTRTATRTPIELAFGQSQNGTELVTALLQRARDAGATYVGDLAFHMVFKWRGSFVECETKLRVGGEATAPAPAPPPAPAADDDSSDGYSTEVTSFQPHEVSFDANERELACKQVAIAQETEKRRYDSRVDAQVSRKSDQIPVDLAITTVNVDDCRSEQVQRRVERYDYQVRLAYVPPDWRYLGAAYASGALRESPPLCYAIDPSALGDRPVHRLTATLGFRGPIEQLEPLRAPVPDFMKPRKATPPSM